jgi:hypothetical protein
MLSTDILYMGFHDRCPRGVYIDVGSNVNSEAADLDVEYVSDASDGAYIKVTGTVSGTFTIGETVTGTDGGSGVAVLGTAALGYLIIKTITGAFFTSDTILGGSSGETVSTITAIATESKGTPYWADVGGDSDGTKNTQTLDQDGLYSWTLPSSIEATVNGVSSLHWIRFKPSIALSTPLDLNEIIPVCPDVNYGYFEAGVEYEYLIDTGTVGGIETDMASGTATLNVTFVRT